MTPRFSANRTVCEYTEQHYLRRLPPTISRVANQGASGRQMVDWRHNLEQKWAALRFGELKVETKDDRHLFEVQVYFKDLDPNAVRVELYADGVNGGAPVRQAMKRVREPDKASRAVVLYRAAVPVARPPADYTARVIPCCDGMAIPLEVSTNLWQR